MPDITIDDQCAEALKFVTDGAGKGDHDSLIFITVSASGTATISTNTIATQRLMTVQVDSPEETVMAVRANALSSMTDKVDEDQKLSMSIRDNKLYMAVGATSATLHNLADYAVDCTKKLTQHPVVNVPEAYHGMNAIVQAVKAVSSNNGVINISGDDTGMAIGSGSEAIYTQELIPATILCGNEEYRMEVHANHLRSLTKLSKIEVLDNIEIAQGTGFASFTFPVNDATTHLKSITVVTPTVVSARQSKSTPCDEDIIANLTTSRISLNTAIKPLKGVIPGDGIVTLDSTQTGRVVIKVNDSDSDGRTVIVDAVVDKGDVVSTSLANLQKALQTVKSDNVNLGKIIHNDQEWIAITGVDDDDEDNLGNTYDFIVAVSTESLE